MKHWLESTKFYIALLLLLAIITHSAWFTPGTTLFYGDWKLLSNDVVEGMLNYGRAAWIDVLGLGKANIQLHNFPYRFLWGIIGSPALAIKITLLWPIAILSFLSPFYLSKVLNKNNQAAFLTALAFGLNTYLIVRTTKHLPIAMVIVLTPLILAKTIQLLHKSNHLNMAITTLLLFLAVIYELRIALIVIIMQLILMLLYNPTFIFKRIVPITLFSTLFILLNAFWILPVTTIGSSSVNEVAARSVWGDDFTDSIRAYSVSDYKWTGDRPTTEFIAQPTPAYAWIVPIFALFTILRFKSFSRDEKKLILSFSIMVVIGTFLVKQNAAPFPESYTFIFEEIPFFGLYRVASKFNLITIIGYAGLISFSAHRLVSKKGVLAKALTSGVLFLLLVPAAPLLTRSIGTLYIDREEPAEYAWLNENYLKSDQFKRSLWIPHFSNWGHNSSTQPKVSFWNAINSDWQLFKDDNLDKEYDDLAQSIDGLDSTLFNHLIDSSSVHYIIVPKYEEIGDDEIFDNIEQYQLFVNNLRTISYLQEIEDANLKGIKVFENTNYDEKVSIVGTLYTVEGTNDWDLSYDYARARTINDDFAIATVSNKEIVSIPGSSGVISLNEAKKDNVITNGSFENGLWSSVVGDCNNNSPEAFISMDLSSEERLDGAASLRLGARNHIACTQTTVPVEPNSWYLLDFSHKGDGGTARYDLSSRAASGTLLHEKIDSVRTEWGSYRRLVYIPADTTEIRLTLYGEPGRSSGHYSYTYYDDIKLQKYDDYNDLFDFESSNPSSANQALVSSLFVNPNKQTLQFDNMKNSFVFSFAQRYHTEWSINIDDKSWLPWKTQAAIPDNNHFELNGWQNGWFIDINDLCIERQLCSQNADGSWDIDLVIEFTPQRWFYVGSIISGITFTAMISYLGYDGVKRFRAKRAKKYIGTHENF